jgi:hypothetical protein
LCRLCFGEIVDYFLVWVGLLDIIVIEVDDRVAVGEDFPLYSIVEYNFLFPILINSLDLTIMTYDLFNHLHVGRVLVMIN